MIIRRRHTANFTTIGNALFEDARLALDEVGLMAWLLSRPHDWEVRRPALMRRFKIGRDGMRRIIRALIRYGWISAQITRLQESGRVHVIYEVRDEPGPELSDDEAKAALSLVSSGAGPGESTDDDGEGDGTEGAEAAPPDADPGGGLPPTGEPAAASRLRQIPPGHNKELLNTDSVNTESRKGARAFSDVREVWPVEHVVSFAVCEGMHADLTDARKEAAFLGVKPYLADCKTQNRKICDLATYYRERRWERFQVLTEQASGKPFTLRRGMPELHRWREYYERADKSMLARVDRWMAERGQYTVPDRWPPPLPPKVDELADEDLSEFIK